MTASRVDPDEVVVLAVEPNPGDARLLREILSDARIANDVHVVDSGDDAIDYLHQRGDYADSPPPDVVLLEPRLPGTTGEEVLAELDDHPDLGNIPVVAMACSDLNEDILRSRDLGANTYLQKPIDPDEFLGILRSLGEFGVRIVRLSPAEAGDGDRPRSRARGPDPGN